VALALGLSSTLAARSAISGLVSAFGRAWESTLAASLFSRSLELALRKTLDAFDASRDDDFR
jgi:hypothetical protein